MAVVDTVEVFVPVAGFELTTLVVAAFVAATVAAVVGVGGLRGPSMLGRACTVISCGV